MAEKPNQISNVYERDIDSRLVEHLSCRPALSAWLAEKTGLKGWAFNTAKYASTHSRKEVDVRVEFHKGNQRAILLIENKINASFSKGQVEGYAMRVMHEREQGADVVVTCLLAPENYPSHHPEWVAFDHHITYENLQSFIVSVLPEKEQQEWMFNLLEKAIEKGPKPRKIRDFSLPFKSNAWHHAAANDNDIGRLAYRDPTETLGCYSMADCILRFYHAEVALDRSERTNLIRSGYIDDNGLLTNKGQTKFIELLALARATGKALPPPLTIERGRVVHAHDLWKRKIRKARKTA